MSPTPAVSLILHFAQCTGIQDTLRFWIPCCGFQIPDTKLQILCQWILDFNHYWDSGFLKKYSGLQKPGILDSEIPDSKAKTSFWYSDSLMWGETLRTEVTLGIHPLYSCIYIYIYIFIFLFFKRVFTLF